MKDFSTILLTKILRATVEHLQEPPEIDHASPGLREFKRTLLAQIVSLQAIEPGPGRRIVEEMTRGTQWILMTRP
jgi:hypothetical protein